MLYLIPGLGADYRVFQALDLSSNPYQVIQYEMPLPDQSLEGYAESLLDQIDLDQPIELLGVSFGGVVAQELSHILPCKRLILVSSVIGAQEFSIGMRITRWLNVGSRFSGSFLKKLSLWIGPYFFQPINRVQKNLLRSILADTDPDFLHWAIKRLLQWKGYDLTCPVVRIHGNKDRIFPMSRIPTTVIIKGGGHFMIVTHAQEIGDWIKGDWGK